MGLSIRQAIQVGGYVMKHRLRGEDKYPLVLMLEPLFQCNLACAGCGKIQHPKEILQKRLSLEECLQASDECPAPVVSIAGGEPLIHPEMPQIVEAFVKRKKFVYLCTNGLLLESKLDHYTPSPYLCFSLHLDGFEAHHDQMVCRPGTFQTVVKAIQAAKAKGFQVDTNTTVYSKGMTPEDYHRFFDFLMGLGVDGMMIAPGFAYEKAPDQESFLKRADIHGLFQKIFNGPNRKNWKFNHSKFYLEFLMGRKDYPCTPWGNPCRNVLGWQRPCYLIEDGYAKSFKDLMETTPWDKYGAGRNPKCADCMAHCGYEPSAVLDATRNLGNMIRSVLS